MLTMTTIKTTDSNKLLFVKIIKMMTSNDIKNKLLSTSFNNVNRLHLNKITFVLHQMITKAHHYVQYEQEVNLLLFFNNSNTLMKWKNAKRAMRA